MAKAEKVTFLNPRTCGIYKNGAPRFKTDPKTGLRTDQLDNELIEAVDAYLNNRKSPGQAVVPLKTVYEKQVIVPTYFDVRYGQRIKKQLRELKTEGISLGELIDNGTLSVRGGHGSPGNDQRTGHIPYIKVSDIRGLRININPTNLVSSSVARRMWRGDDSKLEAWDVITPNRASSNIGEFAILLPGEENIVVTKEVFIFRVEDDRKLDPYYLLWALSLRAVREQWRRIALMQTNREDCGKRHREIIIPKPLSKKWATNISASFRDYFQAMDSANSKFRAGIEGGGLDYIASVMGGIDPDDEEPEEAAS